MFPAQHGHTSTSALFGTSTQPPASVSMNTLYEMLTKMDKNMQTRFDGLERQLSKVNEDIKTIKHDISELDSGLKYVDAEMHEIKEDIVPKLERELLAKIDDLNKSKLQAELYSKKSNLLFFNIPQSLNEDTEVALRSVLDSTPIKQADILFANVHRLPTKASSNIPNPIIAKFIKMKDRDAVLDAVIRAEIKVDSKKIIAAPHLPASMSQERKRLVPIRNKFKAEGREAKIKVTGTKVLLYVNNAVWKE